MPQIHTSVVSIRSIVRLIDCYKLAKFYVVLGSLKSRLESFDVVLSPKVPFQDAIKITEGKLKVQIPYLNIFLV